MIEYVKDYLKMNDVQIFENKKLKDISPVKIGNEALIVAYPKTQEIFVRLVLLFEELGVKYKVVGRMSNILPPDEVFCGIIVRTDALSGCEIHGCEIIAESGMSLPRLSQAALSAGLCGFEELSGIPGSVGGGIFGNAGAFGREICDALTEVTYLSFDTKDIVTVKASDLKFGYRSSSFNTLRSVILQCRFRASEDSRENISRRMSDFKKSRNASQPQGVPSLGSVFKRPSTDISAGKLIDMCGLKGYSVNDATISEKHAGFIVNNGCATAKDYIAVMDYAEQAVYERFKLRLEREIEVIEA